MVTENGSVKASARLDAAMQRELSAGTNRLAVTMITVGAVGVALFITMYVISGFVFRDADDFYFLFMSVAFAVLLGGGIGLKMLIKKNLRAALSAERVNEYEFFRDYFILTEYLNGEKVGAAKVFNRSVIRVRESKNYLFMYITASAVYPVCKADLEEGEVSTIKGLLMQSSSAPYGAPVPPAPEAEPQDPFGEFK